MSPSPALLARATLYSVGAPRARFEPITIDFCGRDGRPDHTLLSLRNGGGKSSLINLLFSLVLPNANRFVGKNERGAPASLADYIGSDDTGHVVLEWRPADDVSLFPRSVVTGVAMQWKSLRNTGKLSDLERHFYALSCDDQTQLRGETLPFVDADGRRLRLTTFLGALDAAAAREPGSGLERTTNQAKWAEILANHGVDVELFDIQADMNAHEGGAGSLVKRFGSPHEFVDFLVDQVVPATRLTEVNATMAQAADDLRRREGWLLEQRFLDRVLGPLREAAELDVRLTEAEVHVAGGARTAGLAALQLELSGAVAERAALEAEEAASQRRSRSDELERKAETFDEDVADHTHALALLEQAAAQDAASAAVGAAQTAKLHLSAWDTLDTVLERRRRAAELADLEARQQELELGAEPARRRRDAAASAYAHALDLAIERHASRERDLGRQEGELREAVTTAREAAARAASESEAREREAKAADTRFSLLRSVRAELVIDGVLTQDESPEQAVERLAALAQQAAQARDAMDHPLAALRAELDELDRSVRALEGDISTAVRAAEDDERDLASVEARYDKLAADPEVMAVTDHAEGGCCLVTVMPSWSVSTL